jgi:hypothetical protein
MRDRYSHRYVPVRNTDPVQKGLAKRSAPRHPATERFARKQASVAQRGFGFETRGLLVGQP